ncbi:unnamed protein product [Mesocestoides corti]|uniref:Growth hormone-inducible transmembrane protein n=1 Tax=Mesocestoides corti TaxID=53468 RepID=A0A0R3U6V5_MESCO|nr:unnamed protein product [Mesocestoides corti]
MNSISRLCHFHGGLLTAKNSLRLQALALREFKTGVSPLRASMRSRMARIRQQAENRTPFSQTQSIFSKTLHFSERKCIHRNMPSQVPVTSGTLKPVIMPICSRHLSTTFPFTAIDAGRAVLLGGAALGLGGLCLYGVYGAGSGSSSLSALDRAAVWPDYVRQRIHSVYAYLGGGAAVAGASAVALVRSPAFIRVMAGGGLLAPLAMLAASIGAGVVCQASLFIALLVVRSSWCIFLRHAKPKISHTLAARSVYHAQVYPEGFKVRVQVGRRWMIPYPVDGSKFNTKHLAWLVYAASLGGILAPICLVGGPILTRAALYTGGIVGGLSAVAISAPSDRFLTWGGPLAIGLGVVFVSSLGSMFLSPMGRLGAGLYGISLYGGLVLFSGFMLYDTQMVIRRAEQHPPPNRMIYGSPGLATRPFDPINNSIKILLDTVNIFVRMVAIFAGGNSRRK